MAMMIPAFWGGKSLHHVLTVYLAQAGGYNGISINGPSLYNLLPSTMDSGMLYDFFGNMAMALGLAMMVVVCLMLCLNRTHITREGTLLACLLVLGGVPFFLPKMHERYTFGADVLALATESHREEMEKTVENVITVPDTVNMLLPSLGVVPLQLFSYYVALQRGCDIDKPRNLAKSVTVE